MDKEIEIDLRDLLVMFCRSIKVIVLSALLGGTLAFMISYFWVTPMYTASASMYVSNNDKRGNESITAGDLSASQSLVDTYIVVLKSDSLLTKVAAQLPSDYGYTPEDIRKEFSASSINGTEAFMINIADPDPLKAQTIVNTIADVAPSEIIRVVKAGEVEVIDFASLPEVPDWPLMRNTAIGILLGLLLSMLGIVFKNLLDVTIHTAEDLTNHYDLPVLGEIPNIAPMSTQVEVRRASTDEKVEV